MSPPRPAAPRTLGLLAGALVVLAGCAAPPPATGTVEMGPLPASVTADGPLVVTFRITGSGVDFAHLDVHYGPEPPEHNVWSFTAPANATGGGAYRAELTQLAPGTTYLRVHGTAAAIDLWGDIQTINVTPSTAPKPAVPTFRDVRAPDPIEAGVAFKLRYRFEGQGTSNHVGAHFSKTTSRDMPAGFQPGTWQGQRASQHLGTPTAVRLPLDVEVDVLLPETGTWYLRPHAVVNGTTYWGEEMALSAGEPAKPNIVLLSASALAVANRPLEVTFALNAPRGVSGHVGAHFSQNSSGGLPAGFAPGDWPGMRKAPHHGEDTPVAIPGVFTTNLTFPLPGTWYYRAHAIVGADSVWSSEVGVAVSPPPRPEVVILSAPREFSVAGGAYGLQVQPITVEWAVVSVGPAATEHTHVHHGPQPVAQPAERGTSAYPAATAPQNGTVPAVFRANVTIAPTGEGPYHLRAMAILPGEDGQPVEVWSDEWVVQVRLR